jgi:hypothetical protein
MSYPCVIYEWFSNFECDFKGIGVGVGTFHAADFGGHHGGAADQFDTGVDTDTGTNSRICREVDLCHNGSIANYLLDRWRNSGVYQLFIQWISNVSPVVTNYAVANQRHR